LRIRGEWEAHDFYIEILLRTGALGLLALLALTLGLLVATWRRSTEDAGVFGSGVLAALLMMQLIWFITWAPGIEQGIVTGIAISLARGPTTYRPLEATVGLFGGSSTQRTGV
jgi:O-antigen ligase